MSRGIITIDGGQFVAQSGTKVWRFPLGNAKQVADFARRQDFILDDRAEATLTGDASRALDADIVVPGFNPEYRLYGYQRAGIKYAVEKRRAWIADAPGLGKTVQAQGAVILGDALPAIVTCPVNVLLNWPKEIDKFFPGRTPYVVEGIKHEELPKGFDFYIVGYSVIGDRWQDFLPLKCRSFIGDEGHYFKNGDRQKFCSECGRRMPGRSNACMGCRDDQGKPKKVKPEYVWTVKRTNGVVKLTEELPDDGMRLLLTGTPLKNGRAKELVNQLRVLGRLDDFGGQWRFERDYAGGHLDDRNHWDASGLTNAPELQARLRSICMMRRTHKEVNPELPEVIHKPVWLTVDKPKMAEYRRIEADVITYLAERARQLAEEAGEDGDRAAWEKRLRAEAAKHLVTLTTLRQAAVNAKLDAIHTWLEDFMAEDEEAKLLMWGDHVHVVEGIYQKYLPDAVMIRGGVTAQKRDIIAARFQTDPACRLFVGNMDSASEGLTLTAAYDVAFGELDWTPATHDQCAGRCYGRANDPHGCTAHYLLLANTIDEWQFDLLLQKRDKNGAVLDGGGSMKGTVSVMGQLLINLAKRGMAA